MYGRAIEKFSKQHADGEEQAEYWFF